MVHLPVLPGCSDQHLWAAGASPLGDVLPPGPPRPYGDAFSDRHGNYAYYVEGGRLEAARAGRTPVDTGRNHFTLFHPNRMDRSLVASPGRRRIRSCRRTLIKLNLPHAIISSRAERA